MGIWKKLQSEELKNKVFKALSGNANYYEENILGIPGSHLDDKVFYQDNPILKNAPFLSTLIHNPNHIGYHTEGESENFFSGTQKIERELIRICAEDILKGEELQQDGYVAAGGTEANMQAIWIYRNYFMQQEHASISDICIICSEDSHYSMNKAANVFNIPIRYIEVNNENRSLNKNSLVDTIHQAQNSGIKHFIIVANMMTTMYGSVDDIDLYTAVLEEKKCSFKIHVDGAFGGFFYPFSNEANKLDFSHPKIDSITLDAHKMLQAPYGTGIFLIRKGYMQYTMTKEASYVKGEDYTLIGSRSGANAIAIWMILMTYGPYGWMEKIHTLINRTDRFCKLLDKLNIEYFRHKNSNIVTIKAKYVTQEIATKYSLVPDNHQKPEWQKVVVMDHVNFEKLLPLVEDLKKNIA
jgi:tyrosine decarboxylase / aspartate 1-decarboxylase